MLEPTIVDADGNPVATPELMMLNIIIAHQNGQFLDPAATVNFPPRLCHDWSNNWRPSERQAGCCEHGFVRYAAWRKKVAEDKARKAARR